MREKILLSENWLFHLGDVQIASPRAKGPVYMQAKTEAFRIGPACVGYKDCPDDFGKKGELTGDNWERVTLPHDYTILQEPKRENNYSLGGFRYENAWYRYHFRVGEVDKDKRICFYFEAVALQAVVYCNGCFLEKNDSAYTSFEIDVTDFLRFEEDNVLAVYVKADGRHEGWWYDGAGIYRPVWMVKTEKVSVDLYGVSIKPKNRQEEKWLVPVEVTVRNDDIVPRRISVKTVLRPPQGEQVAEAQTLCVAPRKGKETVTLQMEVEAPSLWDVDNPVLYQAETTICEEVRSHEQGELYKEGRELDHVTESFGFRSIAFDADRGFFLNGRRVLLKGVNMHQDYGLTGRAVPERVQRYRLKLLKEMGCNAFRCSHYPHSQVTMDALDEMGFLVIAETRTFSSGPEGLKELEMLVKRDRNRPSVILWSVGNEEPIIGEEAGKRIAETMKAFVQDLDSSRPVTMAVCHNPLNAPGVPVFEVLGINYRLYELDEFHRKYPKMPLLSTECCATGTTRGWYFPENKERQYLPAYDRDYTDDFIARERTWKFLMERPWIGGCFQWDGIEHRGEAVYPRLCSQSGAIDLYLQKKDAFYQNQAYWREEPMVHLLPHWNFEGHEGEEIRVVAYTNCPEAELYLNGESQGLREIESYGHGEWKVAYVPGRLEVIARRDGLEAARDAVETSGKAYRLRLRLEEEGVVADGRDVAILTCWVEDEQGVPVPDAEPVITFFTNELGEVAGTGSDISDHVPPACSVRRMRAGLCSVLVRAGRKSGKLLVWAKAEGLKRARLEILLREGKGEDAFPVSGYRNGTAPEDDDGTGTERRRNG